MVSQVSRIQSDLIVIGNNTLLRTVLSQAQKDYYSHAELPLIFLKSQMEQNDL